MPKYSNEHTPGGSENGPPAHQPGDETKGDYYYDDAHGYKSYDPEEDEDAVEGEKKTGPNLTRYRSPKGEP